MWKLTILNIFLLVSELNALFESGTFLADHPRTLLTRFCFVSNYGMLEYNTFFEENSGNHFLKFDYTNDPWPQGFESETHKKICQKTLPYPEVNCG
jgi:hypothetical protein